MAKTATSTTSGTSYQRPSTFLFVPNALGSNNKQTGDDTNTPGAYFRLGGYSEIEHDAKSAVIQHAFYPRQHMADNGSAANSPVTLSAGLDAAGKPASGIMLACNGRLLIRSGEATYLHSTKQIHIDTEDKFTLKVATTIDITSGDNIKMSAGTKDAPKDITITAGGGQGTLTQTAKEAKTHLNGNDYKYVTKDSFTYYECDIYTYKLGGIVDVNMGGRFAYWAGSQLSITTSIDMTISLSLAIAFYFFKFEVGAFKFDVCAKKYELKEGVAKWSAWNWEAAVVKANTNASKTDLAALKSELDDLRVTVATVNAETETVTSQVATLDSKVTTLSSYI